MTDQTNEEAQPVDQTPPLAVREPKAITPFVAGGALAAMVPQTPEEYARLAGLLIEAGCIPASYESREAGEKGFRETRAKLIIGLMKSVEIGVPPITGLNGIMIVNNRPSVWGDLAISLVQRGGQVAKMEVHKFGPEPQPGQNIADWSAEFGYRVMIWRKGQDMPYIGEFTVGDAKRANLWLNTRKQPWINYPLDMLFNRARAKALRMGFADYLHGMGIVEEERDLVIEHKPETAASLLSDEPVEDAEAEEIDAKGEQA